MKAGEQVSLKLYEVIGSSDAISSADGELVFKRIDQALRAGAKVELDFQNIDLVVSTFLNAAVGQIYGVHEPDFIRAQLSVKNISKEDENLLRAVTKRAREYFQDKPRMDQIISNALEDDPES